MDGEDGQGEDETISDNAGQSDFGNDEITFSEHWGWLATIDDLAKGNRKDWQYYLDMNIVEFFNELAFRKDQKKEVSDMITKLIKGRNPDEATALLLSYIINKY